MGRPAYAHNALTSSDPSDGATMEEGPAEVRLTFLATIDQDNADVTVAGPGGRSATAGEPDFDGSSLTVPVEAIWAGDYEIAYQVMSTDGHLVEGRVAFTVTVGQEPTPTSGAASPAAPPAGPVPTPAAAGAGEGGPPGWWPWLILLVLVAAGAGGPLLARRRRRERRSEP